MAIKLVKDKKSETLYVKNALAFYAAVHTPKRKYNSEDKEYTITLFVSEQDFEKLDDEVKLNKTLFKVDKDKNKKRKIKYSSKEYPGTEGMYGFTVTVNEFNKKGEKNTVLVAGEDGKKLDPKTLIGNGSKVSVKAWGYRNEDDLLVILLNAVKVEELVPYEGSGGFGEDDELGIHFDDEDKVDFDSEMEGDDEPPFDKEGDSDDDEY